MRIKTLSTAATEPVTATEAKNFLKQVETLPATEESLIVSLIKTARQYIEKYTGISLTEKSYELYISQDELEDNRIEIPNPPVHSITKIEIEDEQGALTELTKDSDYYVTGRDKKTVQILTSTVSTSNYISRYVITYKAGYGIESDGSIPATEPLPEALKVAILQQILIWYERDGTFEPTLSTQVKMICSEFTDKCSLQ